jgi:hypothetical protein
MKKSEASKKEKLNGKCLTSSGWKLSQTTLIYPIAADHLTTNI